ncbi:MAG: hypothetical protein ACE366_27830 [Bradymonadia bacterium]
MNVTTLWAALGPREGDLLWWAIAGLCLALPALVALVERQLTRERSPGAAWSSAAKALGGELKVHWSGAGRPEIRVHSDYGEITASWSLDRRGWSVTLRLVGPEAVPVAGRLCCPPQPPLEGWVKGMSEVVWSIKDSAIAVLSMETDDDALWRWWTHESRVRWALRRLSDLWPTPWECRLALGVVEIRASGPGQLTQDEMIAQIGPAVRSLEALGAGQKALSEELERDRTSGLEHTRAEGHPCRKCKRVVVPGERAFVGGCGRGGCAEVL